MTDYDNKSDLDELYQDIIIEHNQNPQNYGDIPNPTHDAEGFNPFCGDNIKVYILLNGCLLYTSPSPRDLSTSRMPSSA